MLSSFCQHLLLGYILFAVLSGLDHLNGLHCLEYMKKLALYQAVQRNISLHINNEQIVPSIYSNVSTTRLFKLLLSLKLLQCRASGFHSNSRGNGSQRKGTEGEVNYKAITAEC